LGFFDSVLQFESLFEQREHSSFVTDKHWSVFFGPITELPLGDADLWEDHGLPVAEKDAYPAAICWEPRLKQRRPGPDTLCYLEGLMRALALTTEDEIDSEQLRVRGRHLRPRLGLYCRHRPMLTGLMRETQTYRHPKTIISLEKCRYSKGLR